MSTDTLQLGIAERLAALELRFSLVKNYTVEAFWHALDVAYDASCSNREVTCVVCGYSAFWLSYQRLIDQCAFGGGKLERFVCPMCDCVFGPQKFLDMTDDFVACDYKLLYTSYAEGLSSVDEVRTFHSLEPQAGGLYLNWGCGVWSDSVATLRSEGWDVWGYEPHAAATAEHVVTTRGAIAPIMAGVFSNNVIEHFRNPVAVFQDMRNCLIDGGVMAHSTPCYEYRFSHTRFHSVFLLGRSADILAERSGFEVIDRTQDGQYGNVVFRKTLDRA